MTGFPILVVLVVAIAITIGIVQTKNANKAWAEAARRLRCRYTGSNLGSKRAIYGELNGISVRAFKFFRGAGKSRRSYTGYRADLDGRVPPGLLLKKQGFFSGVSRFFGTQDIEVDDRQFDQSVVVQGQDPSQVRAFLTRSRRIRILSLMNRFDECQIDSNYISVANRGTENDPARLEAFIRRVADAARLLQRDEERTQTFDHALAHRAEARSEAALQSVQAHNEDPAGTDPDALEIEGELLYLGGHYEQAADRFGAVSDAQPENNDAAAWREISRRRAQNGPPPIPRTQPPPIPVATAETPPPETVETEAAAPAPLPPEPEPTQGDEPVAAQPAPGSAEVCRALFLEATSRFEATQLFEARFEGSFAQWSGIVREISEYSYDLVFKSGPGLIAHFELQTFEKHPYGVRAATAAVQLPPDSELKARLEGAIGEPLPFSGYLLKCDPFNGTLFLSAGTLDA